MDIDYYSIDSETIETLNVLRPPVTRGCRNLRRGLIDYLIGDSNIVDAARDYTIYKAEKSKTSKHIKRTEESSLSLVLQKTCKREIVEKSSLLNSKRIEQTHSHENICKTEDKALIKVSVIPKRNQKPLFNTLETQKKATVPFSKNENSIRTNNLYLLVAGKREKIYEIKTSGSAKIVRDGKVEGVKEINVKQRSKFSKMEKKKKKSVIEKKQVEDDYPNFTFMPCLCKCTQHNLEQDTNPVSSRVKIVGRIGLNEDDKYVMKCAATVNGLPVSTDYVDKENTFYNSLADDSIYLKTTKESQATQVDINVKLTNARSTRDQNVQCNVCDVCVESNCYENSRINSLKATSSPLVIISVYPKQGTNSFEVNTKPNNIPTSGNVNYEPRQTYLQETMRLKDAFTGITDIYNTREVYANNRNTQYSQPFRDNKNKDITEKSVTVKANFANSYKLSPDRKSTKNFEPFETSQNDKMRRKKNPTTKTYRTSRIASPANKALKNILQEGNKLRDPNNNIAQTATRNKSPKKTSIVDKTQQSLVDILKGNKNASKNKRAEVRKQQNTRSRSVSRSRDKGINTDGLRLNNMSEDQYNKKTSKNKKTNGKKVNVIKSDKPSDTQAVMKKSYPQNSISKVSVNIDSEKEYYDVIFQKGKFNTDLIVRQTMKENSSQKYFEEKFDEDIDDYFSDNRKSDSLENFFPLDTTGRHRRSVSQAFNNALADGLPITEHTSRLNVRDSLEINHRRDGKDGSTQVRKRLFEYDSAEHNDKEILAPIKHYIGDNCTIYDPIKRDKEIRLLLGVNDTRTDYDQTAEIKHIVCSSRPFSNHYLFQRTLCESLATQIMLQKSCSCSSCAGINMKAVNEQYSSKSLTKWMENNTDQVDEQGGNKIELATRNREQQRVSYNKINDQIVANNKALIPHLLNQTTQYETLDKSSKNHNIQDFLNVETCSVVRRKAIMLSGQQYRKVKKTIHKVSEKRKKRKLPWNSSIVSIGNIKVKVKSEYLMHWNKEVQTDPSQEIVKCEKVRMLKTKEIKEVGDTHNNTIVLFTRHKEEVNNEIKNKEVRKVISSVAITYTSIAYMNEPTCSITNVGSLGSSNLERKRHQSIETLFRGHKKSHTPNLGASALSLLTEDVKTVSKSDKSLSPDLKPRKPFLRRLMSCLVMHTARSVVKLGTTPKPKPSTMDSSYDSYHIRTSLGAIDMSSSLYDTSASFYSDHTIGPINNKMKRGFFSSVRGFLTARKS